MPTPQRSFSLTPVTGPQRLPILVVAFGYIPPQGRPRTIEQLDVEADLKGRLFSISLEADKGQREYPGGDQTLTLTRGQIELLRQRILEYPFWNPLMADAVADTYHWLGMEGQAMEDHA